MQSETFIKLPACCETIRSLNYSQQCTSSISAETCLCSMVVTIRYSYPPSVVDSRRPLFNAAFRSSVARSRSALKHVLAQKRDDWLLAYRCILHWHSTLCHVVFTRPRPSCERPDRLRTVLLVEKFETFFVGCNVSF